MEEAEEQRVEDRWRRRRSSGWRIGGGGGGLCCRIKKSSTDTGRKFVQRTFFSLVYSGSICGRIAQSLIFLTFYIQLLKTSYSAVRTREKNFFREKMGRWEGSGRGGYPGLRPPPPPGDPPSGFPGRPPAGRLRRHRFFSKKNFFAHLEL